MVELKQCSRPQQRRDRVSFLRIGEHGVRGAHGWLVEQDAQDVGFGHGEVAIGATARGAQPQSLVVGQDAGSRYQAVVAAAGARDGLSVAA